MSSQNLFCLAYLDVRLAFSGNRVGPEVFKTCGCGLALVTIAQYLRKLTQRKKDVFYLKVLAVSTHGCLAPSFLDLWQIWISSWKEWSKAAYLMVARKEKERGSGRGWGQAISLEASSCDLLPLNRALSSNRVFTTSLMKAVSPRSSYVWGVPPSGTKPSTEESSGHSWTLIG